MRIGGERLPDPNDPFRLYQGYLDIVKPVDYENDVAEYTN